MNSDFKIKGDYKSEKEWPTEDSKSEAGHGSQYFDSEHTRGEEEDDDMATKLRVPETSMEDGVRALEAVNHSPDNTSAAEWVSLHIKKNKKKKKKKKSTVERTKDEASVTEGMVKLFERPKERAVGRKEGSTGKHLMLDGFEGDVRGMGTDSEDNKENEGSKGTFKLGATDEASGENNIECSTKAARWSRWEYQMGRLGQQRKKHQRKGKMGYRSMG
ncbi:hypothetical protein SLE2022_232570 [Rubroshorea leprosula]